MTRPSSAGIRIPALYQVATKGIVDIIRYDFRVTSNAMLVMVTALIIGSMALLADLIVRSRDDR